MAYVKEHLKLSSHLRVVKSQTRHLLSFQAKGSLLEDDEKISPNAMVLETSTNMQDSLLFGSFEEVGEVDNFFGEDLNAFGSESSGIDQAPSDHLDMFDNLDIFGDHEEPDLTHSGKDQQHLVQSVEDWAPFRSHEVSLHSCHIQIIVCLS